MFRHYLIIALRHLRRNKTYSFINIAGLVLALSTCIVIYLYVYFENSYDTFNDNIDNIYRLKNVRYYASGTDSSAGTVALLGPTLKETLPEVIDFTRVRKISCLVTYNDIIFREANIFWVDSSFLRMFSFPITSGDAENALSDRYRAVLTKSTAQKYFGNEDPIGETIRFDNTDFIITGIADDVPPNSHIKFDFLLSFVTQLNDWFCWPCNNNNTYVQVSPGTNRSILESKFPSIVGLLHDQQDDGFDRAYYAQPLRDIHLHSNLRFEHEENGSATTIQFLSLIAIIILLIALTNYVNLSTARSVERANEVGLRKTVGAGFWTLVWQFLTESFTIIFIAVVVSTFLVISTYSLWNVFVNLPSSFSLGMQVDHVLLLLILGFFTPFIAGFYPAFILSSYSPISNLKNISRGTRGVVRLRELLVIAQFVATTILMVSIFTIDKQLSYMRSKDLGIDINQKLIVNAPVIIPDGTDRAVTYNTFINELRTQSIVEDATFSSIIPGIENGDVTGGVRWSGQSHDQAKQIYFIYVAQNYFRFFDVDLVYGRHFLESELKGLYENGFRTNGLIINESAMEEFGFNSPDEAIGSSIYVDDNPIGEIVGIITNYHQQSLEMGIAPTIFEGVTSGNYFIFNIDAEDVSRRIEGVRNNFESIFPGNSFEYYFLDEFFNRQYNSDIRTANILGSFTFLSISISCLGLFGLASLATTRRTKEIGIRKVVGASVAQVVTLISRELLVLVLIANLIAWPIAWYVMDRWLENFAYRIELGLGAFILAGALVLVIALTTVSTQAIKAATANPVNALRYE
ncbi:MAG: ABC transporter permease [Candidatus Neomarinimicrobiota bacterium]